MTHRFSGLKLRRLTSVALERLSEDPVVVLEGPRSVGKSTLLAELARAVGADLLDLDDPATQEAVARDPSTFVNGPRPVFIEEYQKTPIVLDAIKAELNRDTRPGRFALTGSARHDALPPAAQALTGRLTRLTVHPLSQGRSTVLTRTSSNVSSPTPAQPSPAGPCQTPRDSSTWSGSSRVAFPSRWPTRERLPATDGSTTKRASR